MATTDTRSGFRLPWSSDRSNDAQQAESQDEVADAAVPAADVDQPVDPTVPSPTEVAGQLNETGPDAPPEPATSPAPIPEEPETMVETVSAATPAREAATRKPSKLMADLAAAMRSTAETAREQALSQLDADANQVIETVRARSTEGATELRQRSDEDIAGIRDWSKAEIARIREETDRRIAARKTQLEAEVAGHAAAVEERIEDIQRAVAGYQARMADFFERLLNENDPARLATMAESMPEPPSLDSWADLDDLVPVATATAVEEPAAPEAPADIEAIAEIDVPTAPEAIAEVLEPAAPETAEATAEVETEGVEPPAADGWATAEGWEASDNENAASAEDSPESTYETVAEAQEPVAAAEQDNVVPGWPLNGQRQQIDPWGDSEDAWHRPGTRPEAPADNGWQAADETAQETAAGADHDAPWGSADRGAMMAALEATAEGIAAAEADAARFADEIAGQGADGGGWGAADAQVTADTPPVEGPSFDATGQDEPDPAAEQSLMDRLANLIPRHDTFEGEELGQTQIVVTGLVSVASIASFKRHVNRLQGVQSVTVASGPQGEFVFNVSHRADVSFHDVLPTMPGFGARVTGAADGVINVAAHDPETEG